MWSAKDETGKGASDANKRQMPIARFVPRDVQIAATESGAPTTKPSSANIVASIAWPMGRIAAPVGVFMSVSIVPTAPAFAIPTTSAANVQKLTLVF